MTLQCAVLDDYQGVARELADWDSLAPAVRVEFFADHLADEDALVRRLAPYDVVVVMRERTPITAALLARLPRLRLVVTSGMRNNAIDLAEAERRGIAVCGTASSSEPPTELAWALILAASRSLQVECRSLREGGPWQQTLGEDLHGRTLGLLGLGKIGARMVPVARAFGMEVVAWSPHLTRERADAAGAHLAPTLEAVLGESDIVSVHLGLGEGTRGLLGARELAAMRPGSVLVNTSRAAIVDTDALVAALQSGHLRAAGLDVFDVEPLPRDHPLRSLPNVVATPHLGYVTRRNYTGYFTQAVEDIAAYVDGRLLRPLTTTG